MSVTSVLSRYWRCRLGATAIEYALIAGLVALVLAPGLMWLRGWQERMADALNAKLNFEGAAMVDARSDFREAVRDARDHQGP